jgi:hypothetical protein
VEDYLSGSPLMIHTNSKISFTNKIKIFYGVFRRLIFFLFNRNYISESILKRKGNCLKCGACCKLFFRKCFYLGIGKDGTNECRIYNTFRMPNCINFPITLNDIKDRNIISRNPCGFYFEEQIIFRNSELNRRINIKLKPILILTVITSMAVLFTTEENI